ncbi:MAG TPA: HD domain-containing phosphohydrolase [Pseudomonadales bacterium]|nr:HD domain-containing phosphohydrolase [Pseudomonadales bacterium]
MNSNTLPPGDMPIELYRRLLRTAQKIAAEKDVYRLCEIILAEAQDITGADGGTFYLVRQNDNGRDDHLDFVIVRNNSLGITPAKHTRQQTTFPTLPLFNAEKNPNENNIAACAYHYRSLINVENAYTDQRFDFSGTKVFDQQTGYHSQSFLAVPLIGDSGRVIGVFQLINAIDNSTGKITVFSPEMEPAVQALSVFAAVALDNQIMAEQQKDLLIELSSEPNTRALIERILREAKLLTNADGGTLYLLKDDLQSPRLEFALVLNDTLNINMGGSTGDAVTLPPVPLYLKDGNENHNNVATCAALQRKVINIKNAYADSTFDFSGTRAFDQQTGYQSRSFLAVPLLNHENDVVGVLQLINARNPGAQAVVAFSERSESLVAALASYAAIALTNLILVQELKNLLDAFIRCIAQAIDAKSRHTSAHCQKVPLLMELIAQAANDDDTVFRDFSLNDDEWYELRVAAWLHDCGKLATPDSVLDKSTKLHLMRDGIEAINVRFSSLRQQKLAGFYQAVAENPAQRSALQATLDRELAQLESDRQFIITANKGGEFMALESKLRVQEIANVQWLDADNQPQKLLTDEEVYNLCIERGTLTSEERGVINNHMAVTINMLESLPFPKKLRRVPEYAGGHHEKMDGTGFPRGLKREQMSLPARMMSIADIFEALTARDRPYKPPMKISQALSILKKMRQDNHIDPDLFELFVRSRVWEKYAQSSLLPDQLDVEDASAFI